MKDVFGMGTGESVSNFRATIGPLEGGIHAANYGLRRRGVRLVFTLMSTISPKMCGMRVAASPILRTSKEALP